MAKGADSEEFELLSGPRSGLKREFAFALEAQSQVSGSLGRTRGRQSQKSPYSNGISEDSSIKRFKSSDTEEKSKNDLEKHSTEEEPQNDSGKSPREDESKNDQVKPRSDEKPESRSLKSPSVEAWKIDQAVLTDGDSDNGLLKFPCKAELQSNLVKYQNEEETEKDLAKLMAKEEPLRGCTRPALERKAEPLVMEQIAHQGEEQPEKKGSKSLREDGTSADTPIVIDDKSEVLNASTEKPPRRFTRSALKQKAKADSSVIEDKSKVHVSSPEKPLIPFSQSKLKLKVDPMVLDANRGACSNLELRTESLVIDSNREVQNDPIEEPKNNDAEFHEKERAGLETSILIYNNGEVGNGSKEKPQRRFTRSALKHKVELMVIDDNNEVQNALLEKSPRRFTRSTLESKVEPLEPKAESLVMDIDCEGNNALSEKPLRRFTRSALKRKAEQMEVLVLDTPNEAIEKGDRSINDMVNPLGTPQKKKLEMKMSKKITLTKFPSKVKELLETGMLEGLAVKYVFQGKKNGELRGTIKDHGILCFCIDCKGCNVITSMQFERHAGSTNKHPAYYIYLENGYSLAQVLKACKRAPLDMLEATIQNAIGPSPIEIGSACLNCKCPLPELCARRSIRMCNSCRKLKKSQESPVRTASSDARLSKPALTSKSLESAPKSISPQNKCSQGRLTRKLSKPILTQKSLDGASKSISPQNKSSRGKLTRKSSKPVLTPDSLNISSKFISPQNKSSQAKLTKKDLRLHKLVFEKDSLPDGTELAYYARGQKLLEGYKKGSGIFCRCCKTEISPSLFEAHAGWASRRKPYLHIYTSNGVSLHELAVSLSKGRRFSVNDNDDLCGICADFGDLLLCDGCPRAFHKDCVGQSSIPRGDWYCPYCQNMFEREKFLAHNANAKAAGRVSGVDPIEEISKRCIRIVKTSETEIGGCTLCRCPSFSKLGFGPRTVILCDQCEKEYHVGCLKDHKMSDLKELPKGKWFCSTDCSRIHSVLQKLIVRGSEKLPDSLTNIIKKKLREKCANSNADFDIRWRLLSGKTTSPESRSLLSKAVAIFHDRFDPIVDSITGRDLIPSMVYGRNIRDQEFGGMHCAVLTVDSSVVSAGILRIFGKEAAELPLVATSSDYQGQGCFQALFSCIERLLGFLTVKNFVLPAADEAKAIWTEKFGFKKMSDDQLSMYRKDCQMTIFQGTSMLKKPVPKCRIINKPVKES